MKFSKPAAVEILAEANCVQDLNTLCPITVMVLGTEILDNLLQPSNAELLIVSRVELEKSILLRFIHVLKAFAFMVFKLAGIVNEFNAKHPSNALSPIVVREDVPENMTDCKPIQFLNTLLPISVKPEGICTIVILVLELWLLEKHHQQYLSPLRVY